MRLKLNNIILSAYLPRTLVVWGVLMLLCSLNGCGYATRTALPDNVRDIHVAIFKNSIDITKEVSVNDNYEVYRPNLEVDMRDALIERIFLDGHLKSNTLNLADSILEGEILQYRKDPLRYQDENVREYRISLVCNIKLIRVKDSQVLMDENVTGDTTYFTAGSLQKTETQALDDAMSDLARRIVDRIVDNW
jgi:hypothetical protein